MHSDLLISKPKKAIVAKQRVKALKQEKFDGPYNLKLPRWNKATKRRAIKAEKRKGWRTTDISQPARGLNPGWSGLNPGWSTLAPRLGMHQTQIRNSSVQEYSGHIKQENRWSGPVPEDCQDWASSRAYGIKNEITGWNPKRGWRTSDVAQLSSAGIPIVDPPNPVRIGGPANFGWDSKVITAQQPAPKSNRTNGWNTTDVVLNLDPHNTPFQNEPWQPEHQMESNRGFQQRALTPDVLPYTENFNEPYYPEIVSLSNDTSESFRMSEPRIDTRLRSPEPYIQNSPQHGQVTRWADERNDVENFNRHSNFDDNYVAEASPGRSREQPYPERPSLFERPREHPYPGPPSMFRGRMRKRLESQSDY